MRGTQIAVSWVWMAVLLSCSPPHPSSPVETTLYIYRLSPPAFVEYGLDLHLLREFPFALPPSCGMFNVFSAPQGAFLAVELSCPNGQTVLLFDTSTSSVRQPIPDSDSHFLAWTFDGTAAYLKVDSLGSPRVVRAATGGEVDSIAISELTYDLAASVIESEFTFTFSRGMGAGSELWSAKQNGRSMESLYTDPLHYISFARYSPDGSQLAFIKIPDTQIPFSIGELWVMNADGSEARKLADADAGHGYAANWSPDGTRLAFVVRENPNDELADQSSEALVSNIYVVDVQSGTKTEITHFEHGQAETPRWSPEGNTLAFQVVIDDRMNVYLADLATGEMEALNSESACCPAWVRK